MLKHANLPNPSLSIAFNKVDFCVAPLATFYRRALYIDFLLPLTQKIIGLYIPTTSNEDFDFQTFFTPFRYFDN